MSERINLGNAFYATEIFNFSSIGRFTSTGLSTDRVLIVRVSSFRIDSFPLKLIGNAIGVMLSSVWEITFLKKGLLTYGAASAMATSTVSPFLNGLPLPVESKTYFLWSWIWASRDSQLIYLTWRPWMSSTCLSRISKLNFENLMFKGGHFHSSYKNDMSYAALHQCCQFLFYFIDNSLKEVSYY